MNDDSKRRFTKWAAMGMAAALARVTRGIAAPSGQTTLIGRTRALLDSLHAAALGAFLEDWPVISDRRVIVPSSLPVLRWLPEAKSAAPAFSGALVGELCRVASSMSWRQSYTVPDVDTTFLANYGWSEIVGLSGELPSERIACGFLLLGPATDYARHRHEAEEIYVPLAGTAAWSQGDGIWRNRTPGSVIHHVSDEPHAMRTSAHPLLALYLWRSANLDQKSHLTDASSPGGSKNYPPSAYAARAEQITAKPLLAEPSAKASPNWA